MYASPLYHESVGSGDPIVSLHAGAGVADCRMWDSQVEAFSKKYRVVRFDAQGFGRSPSSKEPVPRAEDLYELLHTLDIPKAHLIGASMGGAAAIDFTLCHPQMVGSLVLVASGLSGYAARDPALVGWLDKQEQRQEKALARGDLDTATQVHLETWLAGPQRRLDDVDQGLCERVRLIAREALALSARRTQAPGIDPPAVRRVDEVRAPTFVMVGEYDVPVVLEIADQLAARIPGSRKRVFLSTAHMLSLERPAEFNKAVLEFLEAYPLR
jgi:pimeloyl-ACP methyl ester carboxylesterase